MIMTYLVRLQGLVGLLPPFRTRLSLGEATITNCRGYVENNRVSTNEACNSECLTESPQSPNWTSDERSKPEEAPLKALEAAPSGNDGKLLRLVRQFASNPDAQEDLLKDRVKRSESRRKCFYRHTRQYDCGPVSGWLTR